MPDDKSIRAQQGKKKIRLDKEVEVKNWLRKFKVSEDELREAVKEVGDSASAIAEFLTTKKREKLVSAYVKKE